MLELKLLKGLNSVYRGAIRLGLRSINARDKRSLRKLHAQLEHAQDTRKLGSRLIKEADVIEDTAHVDYYIKARGINSAHNLLSNALDDTAIYTN